MKYKMVLWGLVGLAAYFLMMFFFAKPKDLKTAVNDIRNSTVSINISYASPECYKNDHAFDACGATGVVVAYKEGVTYILTNKHVAEATDYAADTPCPVWVFPKRAKQGFPGFVIAVSPKTDLALIAVQDYIGEPIKIAKHKPEFLENIFSVGNPGCIKDVIGLGFMGMVGVPVFNHGAGVYRETDTMIEPKALFLADEMLLGSTGGSSGSGIYNMQGELIAVLFAGARVDPAYTLAVPLESVKEFLTVIE